MCFVCNLDGMINHTGVLAQKIALFKPPVIPTYTQFNVTLTDESCNVAFSVSEGIFFWKSMFREHVTKVFYENL